ncbi:DUF262 domain-containing protein [Chryseobacterium gambrini]|uniref:DUF262 domain-containing protein n=1 Tax=Chryseobacterium gambrini TaxID=373672 RepID=UPI003D13DD92
MGKEKIENEESDIEKELGNENIAIDNPFNPDEINIKIVPYTIGQIVDRLNYNEIAIPKYQRIPNLWNPKKKSRFIESIILNLPIPLFYFDNQEDGIWRVIDGLQRISTIEHFISDKSSIANNEEALKLTDLEFLKEYEGKAWKDLPRDIQRKINAFQITINLIDKGTPEEVKFNIFSRINQGGEPLKPQEIRTALFQGYKTDLLEFLVDKNNNVGKSFHKAVGGSVKSNRQDDLDFANRFVAFYILGYESYKPDMDTFLTNGLKDLTRDIKILEKLKSDFKKAMDLSITVFGKYAFRKKSSMSETIRKPISKPLFEIISLHFSKLDENQVAKIEKNKKEFFKDLIILINDNNDKKFFNSISTGTAGKESVKIRHEEFLKTINKYI